MKRSLVILNFTHAYETQPFLRRYPASWVDCTGLQGTDCYCSPESYGKLQELLAPFSPEGLHLIDSGDYHYVTKLWTDKIDQPFSLVLFDHHPDMQPTLFDELLSCGCWVRTMLDTNPLLQKVCIIGANETLKNEIEGYDKRLIFSASNRSNRQRRGNFSRKGTFTSRSTSRSTRTCCRLTSPRPTGTKAR